MSITNFSLIQKIISSSILAFGIATSGIYIGNAIVKFRMLDRQVSVKGLAEKEIISDFATWTITIKVMANSLEECSGKIEQDKKQIIEFLISQGFEQEEISLGNYLVNDLLAQTYRPEKPIERYLISASIILKSNKVELVNKATQSQNILIQNGIIFENEGPFYEFTKFNYLKPEMLAEGIKNARLAAEKFVTDSGIKIGALKKANQGTFLIAPVGVIETANTYENEQLTRKSLFKKIRVVTTLEYFLKDN